MSTVYPSEMFMFRRAARLLSTDRAGGRKAEAVAMVVVNRGFSRANALACARRFVLDVLPDTYRPGSAA